jgi:hypothetical protein
MSKEITCIEKIPDHLKEYAEEKMKDGYTSVLYGSRFCENANIELLAFFYPDGDILLKRFYQKELETISQFNAMDNLSWDAAIHGDVKPVFYKESQNIITKEVFDRYIKTNKIELV